MLSSSHRERLAEAVDLFNREEFFECHEVLEEPWRETEPPDKIFLKGLIHAAVSLYQYQRKNSHGARVKCASCCGYLAPFLPEREGLDLKSLVEDLTLFIEPLHHQPPREPPPMPTRPWPRLRRAQPVEADPRNRHHHGRSEER